MTNIEKFKYYLKCYEEKNLKAINDMFADSIHLRDWKISVNGKQDAILETKKNFSNATSIQIDILDCFSNQNVVAAELKIIVNESEELFVVDVITFDQKGLISSIKAYIGRAD